MPESPSGWTSKLTDDVIDRGFAEFCGFVHLSEDDIKKEVEKFNSTHQAPGCPGREFRIRVRGDAGWVIVLSRNGAAYISPQAVEAYETIKGRRVETDTHFETQFVDTPWGKVQVAAERSLPRGPFVQRSPGEALKHDEPSPVVGIRQRLREWLKNLFG